MLTRVCIVHRRHESDAVEKAEERIYIMTKLILRCICLCVFVFGCRIAMADAPRTSKMETLNLLSEGKYADLEQRFAAVQQAYKHGLLRDEQLLDAFRAFYENHP